MYTLDEILAYVLWGSILAIPTIVLTWYYLTRIRDKKPAYYGRQVQKLLKRTASVRHHKVMEHVEIQSGGKSAVLPHLMIGPFGVLVVTTLDQRGSYFGEAKSKNWIHDDGKARREIPNPYLRTQKAIEVMRDLFSRNAIYSVPVEHIIVFDSYPKKTGCFLGNDITAMRLSQLKDYLYKDKFEKDNGVDEEKIFQLLSGDVQ